MIQIWCQNAKLVIFWNCATSKEWIHAHFIYSWGCLWLLDSIYYGLLCICFWYLRILVCFLRNIAAYRQSCRSCRNSMGSLLLCRSIVGSHLCSHSYYYGCYGCCDDLRYWWGWVWKYIHLDSILLIDRNKMWNRQLGCNLGLCACSSRSGFVV